MIDREKISKQPSPAPTESAEGPCPTLIQISRTHRLWKFTQHHRTSRPSPSYIESRSYEVYLIQWHGMSTLADNPVLVSALESVQLLSVLRKYLVIGQFRFSLFFIGHITVSTFTGTDQYGPIYQIGPNCAGRFRLQSY